jgi:hypothetical protein
MIPHSVRLVNPIVKNKKWAYIFMMFWCMMFAGVVGAIEETLSPKILELTLHMSTFEPIKSIDPSIWRPWE